jgi:acyl dehydratase
MIAPDGPCGLVSRLQAGDANRENVDTGYAIAFGSYEEAKAMVGVTTPVRVGLVEVNAAMIRHFAAMVRDGNAGYWDEEFARAQWGGLISPPAMLMTWLMPIEWEPSGAVPTPLLTGQVPLPGRTLINVSNEAEFFAPIRVGDRLNVIEELESVSEEKRTALGVGHFVTTVSTYRRQDGEVVARNTNVLFRFDADDREEREEGR